MNKGTVRSMAALIKKEQKRVAGELKAATTTVNNLERELDKFQAVLKLLQSDQPKIVEAASLRPVTDAPTLARVDGILGKRRFGAPTVTIKKALRKVLEANPGVVFTPGELRVRMAREAGYTSRASVNSFQTCVCAAVRSMPGLVVQPERGKYQLNPEWAAANQPEGAVA